MVAAIVTVIVTAILTDDSQDDTTVISESGPPVAPTQPSPPATPSEPPLPDSATPIYTETPIRLVPLSCDVNNPSLDFDEPAFHSDYSEGAAYKDADLWYESCVGSLQQRATAFVGIGPATEPTPSACATAANTQPMGRLDVSDIRVGDALCVVTTRPANRMGEGRGSR